MGGDSFPNTRRLSEAEYGRVCGLVTLHLARLGAEARIPVEVSDKRQICEARGKTEPYGDVDVIVARRDDIPDMDIVLGVIEAVDGFSEEIHHNDSTYSFLSSERYQIDIKFCDRRNLDFLAAFKGNNDFGALLGHLLTPLALKWSEAGLQLKLRRENISGVGAVKADLLLSDNIHQVCDFLSLPRHSLDCETSLSCREIFEILTTCRAFFPHEYDEKYKIRERRKRRPVSDTFFSHLEADNVEQLYTRKREKFKEDDEIENLFSSFRGDKMTYDDYILRIADLFQKRRELEDKLEAMEAKLQPAQLEPKFNHVILASWFPGLGPNDLGKLFGKLKSRHSGAGPGGWAQWVEATELAVIREEAEDCADVYIYDWCPQHRRVADQ